MTPIIRTPEPGDADALAALKLETFRESFVDGGFAIPYPADDLALFEAENYSSAKILAEIADPGRASWIAESERRLLGYAQVGPCKLPHPDASTDHGELYQLYVRSEAQGLGIGKRLLTIALDHLGATRPGPVWLGVWSGNEKAQALYRANGFRKVGEYRFPVGSWEDDEFIFRR
jgi:ribosomal protein S18 acetylase RimI-like enzyme